MKKISFIIPAFNAEQYLEDCLNRIFNVKYENYDVIVVDDGSTDRTSSILSAVQNPALKIIRQENAGVSAARNAGLAMTDADYVIFVDVDDVVLPHMLDTLFQRIQFDKDVYMYAYEHEENGNVRKIALPLAEGNYSGQDTAALSDRLLDVKFSKNYHSAYFGAKIYQYLFSVSFLRKHQILFPVGLPFAEDCVFCYSLFRKQPELCVVDLVAYRYLVYPGSASHKYRADFWKEIKKFYHAVCEANQGNPPKNQKQLFYYYYTDIIERTVSKTSQIGKKETLRVIRELYADTAFCTAAAETAFDNFTKKEKIIRSLYAGRQPYLTYLFFRMMLFRRNLKKRSAQNEN